MFRRSIKSVLRRFGYDVVKYSGANFMRVRRIELLRSLEVTVVLDVGANAGQFGSRLREDGYDGRIVSFEPVRSAFERLVARADGRWQCFDFALGAETGEALLNVSKDTWSSSLLSARARLVEAAPDAAAASTATVPVRTLDSVRGTILQPDDRAFLKIDTQGYEHEVLAGADAALRQVVGLELELSLVRLYDGQQLLPQLLKTVDGLGFGLVTVANGFSDPATQELLQIDAIFARRTASATTASHD